MQKWEALRPRYSGGAIEMDNVFMPHYLALWRPHISVVDIYPYVVMDF